MTDHNELRRALSDLASSPPPAPGSRSAAVARKVVVRRRMRAGAASSLLIVAGVAGAFAGGAVQPPRAVSFMQIAGDDDEGRTEAAARESSSPRATSRPSRTATPPARSASASASPRRSPDPSARPSRSPSRSPSPSASGAGPAPLEVRAGVRPSEVRAGERVVVRVGVRDGDGALLGLRVAFGDGQEMSRRFDPRCGSNRPQQTSETVEVEHTYDAAGAYVIRVTVQTGECGAGRERRDSRARVRVLPRDGDRPGNGGALPTARAGQNRPREESAGESHSVEVRVGGADSDGYITKLVLDWGDGTEPTVVAYPLSECRVTDSGYPSSRRTEMLRHSYARDGRYEARLQVVSTGCDGRTEQSGRTATRVLSPVPSRSPRPSAASV
ncbi:MAG TPA: PKD domain-containing protein [Mycobacteriales bacterium]|nr:PKD domain-containing protein [Mycobacteriales bacterium]